MRIIFKNFFDIITNGRVVKWEWLNAYSDFLPPGSVPATNESIGKDLTPGCDYRGP